MERMERTMQRTMQQRIFTGLALCLLLQRPALAESVSLDLVKRAAEVYARETRGIVGYRVVTENSLRAVIFNQDSRSEAKVVTRDGLPQQISIERFFVNGKENKERQKSEEAKTNEAYKKGHGYIKLPCDARFMDDYVFSPGEPGSKAPDGSQAILFSSKQHDEQHGSGRMLLDENLRLIELSISTNVLPQRVTSGSLTFERGQVAPGIIGIRLLRGNYEGVQGPIRGTFTTTQRYEDYRRFDSLEEANAP